MKSTYHLRGVKIFFHTSAFLYDSANYSLLGIFLLSCETRSIAPIVQWIEQETSKLLMWVRFLLGAQISRPKCVYILVVAVCSPQQESKDGDSCEFRSKAEKERVESGS